MTRLAHVGALISLVSFACGGSLKPADGGGGGAVWAEAACTAPEDCVGEPFRPRADCLGPSWSCIDGRCTWECMGGGRTCHETPGSGCLVCGGMTVGGGTIHGCVSDACVIDGARIRSAVRLNCTSLPPIDFTVWSCTGHWAVENDSGERPLCTIQTIPAGPEAWSVSCGGCVTIVVMN